MTIHIVCQNPYRILGVLSNSPLKERVGNQSRLTAFAKVGKEVEFPNDFASILTDKPVRTPDSIAAANTAINLDKDQLKYALFWFISGSPMDDIALKHLQAGNREKAEEIFQKKETYSSLINSGVLAFIDGNTATGFNNISKVIHNSTYRAELLQALGLANLQLTEDDLAEIVIAELLKEVPASKLLSACTNPTDHAIVSKNALEEPISAINSAIAVAKNADSKDALASLMAGTKLMNSTKTPLKEVKKIAGSKSPQYQMVADNVAKQVLQCGINYYNNAPDSDVESPRKAMVLQSYALSIAVGQLTKDRCKENVDILKKIIDELPPLVIETDVTKILNLLDKFINVTTKDEETIRTSDDVNIGPSHLLASGSIYIIPNPYLSSGSCLHYKEDSYHPTIFYNKNNILHRIALYLGKIRDIIGEDNKFFISLCNKIVRCSLNAAIKYVNSELPAYNMFCNRIKSNIDNSLSILDKKYYISEHEQKNRIFQNYLLKVYEYTLNLKAFIISKGIKEWYDNNLNNITNLVSEFCDKGFYNENIQIISETTLYRSCDSISDYLLYQEIYPEGKYYEEATNRIADIERKEREKEKEWQLLEDMKKQIRNLKTLNECIGFKNSYSLNKVLENELDDKAYSLCSKKEDYQLYLSKFNRHQLDAKEQLSKKQSLSVLMFGVFFIWLILLIIAIAQ